MKTPSSKSRRVKIVGGIILVLIVAIGGTFGTSFFHDYRATQAEEAFASKRYAEAREILSSYNKARPNDFKRALLLAESNLYLGEPEKAKQLLQVMQGNPEFSEQPEIQFYLGLVAVGDGTESDEITKIALDTLSDDTKYLPGRYLLAANHIFIDENYPQGKQELKKISQLLAGIDPENAAQYAEDINNARAFFMQYRPQPAEVRFEIPFGALELAPPHFLPANFYDNLYFLPMEGAGRNEQLSLADNMRWLSAFADLREGDPASGKQSLAGAEATDSALFDYLYGYLSAMEGNFTAAAIRYRQVLDFHDNPSAARLMLANAAWSSEGGAKPENKVLEELNQVTGMTATASNNLGYLRIYLNDLESARETLKNGLKGNPDNLYLLLNMSYLDILEQNFAVAEERLTLFQEEHSELSAADIDEISELILLTRAGQHKTEESVALLEARKAHGGEKARDAHIRIADIYLQRGDLDKAIEELEKSNEQFNEDKETLVRMLIIYGIEKETEKFFRTKSELEKIGEEPEKNYRMLLAESLIVRSEDKSDNLFNQAVNAEVSLDERAEILIHRAHALINKQQDVKALDNINKNWDDDTPPTPPLQAVIYRLKSGNTEFTHVDQPKELLAEIIAFADAHPELPLLSQVDLAWGMINLDDPQRAIHQLNAAGDARFNSPLAIQALSLAHGSAGDAQTAEELSNRLGNLTAVDTKETKKDDGQDLPVVIGPEKNISRRLNAAVTAEDYDMVVSIYTQILEEDVRRKQPELTYQNRGAAYLVLERYQEAADDFSKVLEFEDLSDATHGLVLYNYGYALAKLGRFTESIQALKQKLEIQPDDTNGHNLLSQVYIQTSDLVSAAEVLENMIAAHPKKIAPYLKLANMYYKISNNQIDDSVVVLKKALEVDPKNTLVRRALFDLYDSVGDKANAQKYLGN